MAAHPGLAGAHGLKLPHHGSAAAFHEQLMRTSEGVWVLTPFDRSRLPGRDPEGLPRLLERNPKVHLTRIAANLHAVSRGPAPTVPLASLQPRSKIRPTGDAFVDDGDDIRPPECSPLDPVWAFAFDDQGASAGAWYGSEALAVTR